MKPVSGYEPVQTELPFKGLASSYPKTRIPPGYASDLLNVTVRDGVVRSRSGYMKMGQTLDGIPLDMVEFAKLAATDRLIVFTSLAQYWFDSDNSVFVDISVETPWTYAISAAPTASTFTVAEDLSTGNNHVDADTKFIVSGSTANDGTYTVASTSGTGPTVITVDETVPDTTQDGNVIVTRREDITTATSGTRTLVLNGVDLTTYISANDTIYIKDSTGNDGTYTVESVAEAGGNSTLVVDQVLPTGDNDGYISHRNDRTYTDGDILNSEPLTDTNSRRLLHTNGVDFPIQWFGDTSDADGHFLQWRPLYPNFVTMDSLRVFKEHLMLGGVETSADEPQLVAWSDSGDFEDYSTGNSGSQILYELTTGIKQMVNLGDRIIIYSADAIASGIFIGSPFIFAFETVIPAGTRLAGEKGIVSINVGHIYSSEENFYLFDGSRGMRTLGDVIRTDYKDQRKQDLKHQIATLNDFSKRTIYFATPTQDTSGLVYTLEYDAFDLARRAWAKEQYDDHPRSFGFWTNKFVYTWADTTEESDLATALGLSFLPWSQEVGPWANEGEQADFPVRVHGDASGNIYLSSEGIQSDNGTPQRGSYTTGDFTVPKEFLSTTGRWGEVEFEASGDTVTVSTLLEDGQAVGTSELVTLAGSVIPYRIPIDVVSRTLRVKFAFSGSFELRWVRCWVKDGGPR